MFVFFKATLNDNSRKLEKENFFEVVSAMYIFNIIAGSLQY